MKIPFFSILAFFFLFIPASYVTAAQWDWYENGNVVTNITYSFNAYSGNSGNTVISAVHTLKLQGNGGSATQAVLRTSSCMIGTTPVPKANVKLVVNGGTAYAEGNISVVDTNAFKSGGATTVLRLTIPATNQTGSVTCGAITLTYN